MNSSFYRKEPLRKKQLSCGTVSLTQVPARTHQGQERAQAKGGHSASKSHSLLQLCDAAALLSLHCTPRELPGRCWRGTKKPLTSSMGGMVELSPSFDQKLHSDSVHRYRYRGHSRPCGLAAHPDCPERGTGAGTHHHSSSLLGSSCQCKRHIHGHHTCKGKHGLLTIIPPEPGHHHSSGSQHPVHPAWRPQATFSGTRQ